MCEITGNREPKGRHITVGLLHFAGGLLHLGAGSGPTLRAGRPGSYIRPRRAMRVVSERGTRREPTRTAL